MYVYVVMLKNMYKSMSHNKHNLPEFWYFLNLDHLFIYYTYCVTIQLFCVVEIANLCFFQVLFLQTTCK